MRLRRAPGTEGRVRMVLEQARDGRDAWKLNSQVVCFFDDSSS